MATRRQRPDGIAAAPTVRGGQRGRARDPWLAAPARRIAALEAELRATERELAATRTRLAAAADAERRRIARDLHDGGQNRLVALRIGLGLALAEAEEERASARLRTRLAALRDEAQAALEVVRALAHGLCPPLLAVGGVLVALRAEADDAALPVALHAPGAIPRSSPEAEAAVYYGCLEALQNAAKHAGPDAHVVIELACGAGWLHFAVLDDGPGPAAGAPGGSVGLTHVRDRVAAVGGAVELAARAGGGAAVRGRVPWPPRRPADGAA